MKHRKSLIALVLLLLCVVSMAQVSSSLARRFGPTTFAGLGSPSAGNVRYCTNCTAASPCGSGGSGAFAYRSGGAWNCGSGGSGVTSLIATANQTTVSGATGDVTIGIVQSIGTGSTPQFLRMGLNQAADSTASLAATQTALSTTPTDGMILQNTTASGDQYSPRIRFRGFNGSGGEAADWTIELRPVAGASTSNVLAFSGQRGGAGYVTPVSFQVGTTTSNTSLNFNSPAGQNANLIYQNAGVNKWYVRNVGSDDHYSIINSDANGNSEVLKILQTGAITLGGGTSSLRLGGVQTTVPTCSTNCGTSPSVVGTDTWMTVTMGSSGVPASGWVITFNGTWAAAPACVVQMAKAGMVVGKQALTAVTTTTTITVVTNGTAPATTDVYHIHCGGIS